MVLITFNGFLTHCANILELTIAFKVQRFTVKVLGCFSLNNSKNSTIKEYRIN